MRRLVEGFRLLVGTVAFVMLFGLRSVAYATDASNTASSDVTPRNFIIIVGIIVLMASLFYILFRWQQKVERSSYFSRVYQDAIKDNEVNRLTAPAHEKWQRGEFMAELVLQRSPRATEWLGTHRKPRASAELENLASELHRQDDIFVIERSMDHPERAVRKDGYTSNPYGGNWLPDENHRSGGWTPMPGLGGLGGSRGRDREVTRERYEQLQKLESMLHAFSREAEMWVSEATGEAWSWYQAELAEAERTANDQANKALDVDFSALRGRGPEFVLEFTAVVVIIFAAVILGIMGALEAEQIGTLLAAIAGYVLGKGTARSRPEPQEQKGTVSHPVVPAQPGGNGERVPSTVVVTTAAEDRASRAQGAAPRRATNLLLDPAEASRTPRGWHRDRAVHRRA